MLPRRLPRKHFYNATLKRTHLRTRFNQEKVEEQPVINKPPFFASVIAAIKNVAK